MNYRNTELLDATDLGASGTEIIDIKVRQPISRITLQWAITRGLGNDMDSYPHKDISKIELVDGSDRLHSLDGGQNQALCMFNRRVSTMNNGNRIPSNAQKSTYAIDFGRFLYDPELALDPSKFSNPQLKVTYNEAVSDTECEANTLEVWADVFDEKVISPIGFLMSKELHSRTPPASGYWYVDLPTDHPLRTMLIQGYRDSYEPWYQVSEARLSEENDKRIPFDVDLEDYFQLRMSEDVPVEEVLIGQEDTTGTVFYVIPTNYWTTTIAMPRTSLYALYSEPPARGGKITLYAGYSMAFMAIVKGWCPNHCFHFPFGNPQDMDDWYDVTRLGSLRLRLKAGSGGANGTAAVVLQQLRRY